MSNSSSSYTQTLELPDGFEGPCWCGEERAWFSEIHLEDGCAGTGYLHCFCGGDFCVCHNHGGTECPGCDDCEDIRAEDFDDLT